MGLQDIWVKFWENARFIRKKHFSQDRRMYEPKNNSPNPPYYWDQVNASDLAMVLARTDEDWRYDKRINLDKNWYHTKPTQGINVIQFKCDEGAQLPRKLLINDAEYDLPILHDVVIQPWQLEIVPTGLHFAIPGGYYGQIQLRSSIAKQGVFTEGGVIDSGYIGDVKLLLGNRNPTEIIKLYQGDYVAQLIIHKIYEGDLKEVTELPDTQRGNKGFRSTGINAVILKKEITEVKHEQQKTDKTGYKIGTQLTPEQTDQLRELLKQFGDIMATTFEDIRVNTPKYYHDIDTGDAKPIKSRPYQVLQAHREWQRQENK